MPPPPPGSHNANPTEAYFEPNTSSNNNPYAQGGTLHQATALIPQSPQIMSPTSAGGTVVVSAMTPHPVMAVHAAPPGVNGVPIMNGGLLGGPMGHTPTTLANRAAHFMESTRNHRYFSLHLLAMPIYHLCLPMATELEGEGLLQPVGGASHHQTQYVYASAATAVGTMGSPHLVYKFHQVHPSAGRTYSTY